MIKRFDVPTIAAPARHFSAAVEIPPGSGTNEIGRRLVESGVVRDLFIFRAAMWQRGRDRTLKAGEYRFTEPVSVVQVVDKIARGDVYARRITFPEGLTIGEMALVYEAAGFGAGGEEEGPIGELTARREMDRPGGRIDRGHRIEAISSIPASA